jgi:hypothetical protein
MGQSGVPSISNPVAEIVIGRPATAPTERWTGAVAEVLVFNTTHDEVTRGRIERYLANKYGISITPVKTPGKLTNRIGMSAPSIVTSGLVMRLDAGNASSYPGSGTTWTDLSGQGNNATLTNGPTYDSGNGGSIIFDGSDDYAPTTANGFSFGSSPGTISCWAKTATILGSWSWIFAYGTPSLGASRFLGINGSDYYVGGYGADITASGVPLNTWFNMVGVYDGTNASMYINGTLVSGPTPQSWNTVSSVSVVGRQTNNSEYWNGNIAQVLVYDRDLTAGEILQNFNVDKSRFGL